MTPALALASCGATAWQAAPDLPLRAAVMGGLTMLFGWALAQRHFAGRRVFLALVPVMLSWVVFTTVEHAAVDIDCKTSIALLAWPAVLMQPVLWSLFLQRHVQSLTQPASPWTVLGVALPSLALTAAIWSNGSHGLMYGPATAYTPPMLGLPRVRYDYGPLFYVAILWGYTWMAAGMAALLQAWWQARGRERRQWWMFALISGVPALANMAYIGLGWRVAGGDPTPLTFALSLAGFGWLIRSGELFRVLPLARSLLFNELPDAVLVLDRRQRVVEANRAALLLAGDQAPVLRPLRDWPRIGTALQDLLNRPVEYPAMLPLHQPEQMLEVHRRAIGSEAQPLGHLLQLRDVTLSQRVQNRLVQTLAERSEQLQQVAALQHELREQVLRDPLTGLHNRRALLQDYGAEATRPLTLALIDLDHFKRINDSLGHAAGDRVLCDIAGRLRGALRTGDGVYRIGGEEFALLLPGASLAAALQRLETLRQAVSEATLDGADRPVTLSCGLAEAGVHGSTLDALLAAADAALYRAKAAGRNRVLAADGAGKPHPPPPTEP